MRTLDEVIDLISKCNKDCGSGCDFYGAYGCRAMYVLKIDALHYLKELRDMTDIPMEYFESGGTSQKLRNTSQITCPKCHSEFVILPEANNPLTWDELKQMEGKPVWVEADYFKKGWFLVDASLVDIWVTGYDCAEHQLREEDIGVSWQAYRKERL